MRRTRSIRAESAVRGSGSSPGGDPRGTAEVQCGALAVVKVGRGEHLDALLEVAGAGVGLVGEERVRAEGGDAAVGQQQSLGVVIAGLRRADGRFGGGGLTDASAARHHHLAFLGGWQEDR